MADLTHLIDTSRSSGYEYGNILPFRKPIEGGPAEWNLGYSGLIKSISDAMQAPGQALAGQEQSPEAGINFALNMTGGGGTFGRVPQGAVGMAAKGMKRIPPLWHGTPANNFEQILADGLLHGKSAELQLPGSSLSRDPIVSTDFARLDPYTISENFPHRTYSDILKETMLQAKLNVPKEEIVNLRPSQYISGHVPETVAYNKPNKFFGEKETFVRRKSNEQVNKELVDFITGALDPEQVSTLGKFALGNIVDHPQWNPLTHASSWEATVGLQPPTSVERLLAPQIEAAAKKGLSIPVDVAPITGAQANAIAQDLFARQTAHQNVIANNRNFASLGPDKITAALDATAGHSALPTKDIIGKLEELNSYLEMPDKNFLNKVYKRIGEKVHPFWQGVMKSPEKIKEMQGLIEEKQALLAHEQQIQAAASKVRGGFPDNPADKTNAQKLDDLTRAFPKMRDQLDARLRRFLSTPHKAGTKIGDKSIPADIMPEAKPETPVLSAYKAWKAAGAKPEDVSKYWESYSK